MAISRACLLSLPWDYYQSPSIAIGCLAAYARKKGCEVDALHLHLEAAAFFDLRSYDLIAYKFPVVGEALAAMQLMPEEKDRLLAFSRKSFVDAEECSDRLVQVLRRLYDNYDWSRYRVVGLSIHFAQLFTSVMFASWIKRDHPGVRTILGGGCLTPGLARSLMERFPWIDWCHHGDGEEALVELLRGAECQSTGFEAEVPGLIYRTGVKIQCNPKRQFLDFHGWPDPDYDHYFRLKKKHPLLKGRSIAAYLPVEVSRGCVHRCAFCNFNFQSSYRARPFSEVGASMRRLSRSYRVNSFCLMALMIPVNQTEPFFDAIRSHGSGYRIFCEARANLSKQQLRVMKNAGVTEVQIGIEALDTPLLNKMKKGTQGIENLQVMKFCEELGLKTNSFLMIGFPTETQKEVDRSLKLIDFACGYAPLAQIAPFTLREGSPIDQNPRSYGLFNVQDAGLFSDFQFDGDRGQSQLVPQAQGQINGINYWYRCFRSHREPRDYSALMQRIKRWGKSYESSQASGRPLLSYLDAEEFLTIEDYRDLADRDHGAGRSPSGRTSYVLDGWKRELYLFCDSIRDFDAIRNRFPDLGSGEIRAVLNKLIRAKVMFGERKRYLSLAINAGPECRRFVPFTWF
jgi:ribosomal peptide maturation radical SAM protein 1